MCAEGTQQLWCIHSLLFHYIGNFSSHCKSAVSLRTELTGPIHVQQVTLHLRPDIHVGLHLNTRYYLTDCNSKLWRKATCCWNCRTLGIGILFWICFQVNSFGRTDERKDRWIHWHTWRSSRACSCNLAKAHVVMVTWKLTSGCWCPRTAGSVQLKTNRWCEHVL